MVSSKNRNVVQKTIVYVVCSLFIIYVAFPIILVLIGSFGKKWYGSILPELFTFRWYIELFTTRQYTNAMMISLYVAFVCVVATLIITILTAYAINTSTKKWLRNVFDTIVLMPVAIPPLVIAIGLIELYTFKNFTLVGTLYIVIAAHIVFTLPFMMKPVMAAFEIINWKTLNEAADSLGSSFFNKIKNILLPNILPGIISGTIMVFAMSLGEFQLALLLSGFKTQTYPVMLREAFYLSTGFACAATSVSILVAFLSIIAILFFVKKLSGEKRFKGN